MHDLSRHRGIAWTLVLVLAVLGVTLYTPGQGSPVRADSPLLRCAAGGWFVLRRDEYVRTQPRVDDATRRRLRAGLVLHEAGRRTHAWLLVFIPHGRAWVLRANLRPACPPTNWRDLLRRAAPPTAIPTSIPPTPPPPAPPPPTAIPTPAANPAPTSLGVIEQDIWQAAGIWGASYPALRAVAACESGLNPLAYNASGASGLFQFMPSTYAYMSSSIPYGGSYWNAYDASYVAAWAFSRGYASQWECAYITGVIAGVPHLREHLRHLPPYCHPPVYKTPASCWAWLPKPPPLPHH